MSFIALIITGLILINKVPVSLLPDIDVPQIVIRISYPNTAASILEQNIIRPIRENLVNIDHLEQVESRSANHTGLLYLTFSYGTKMNLAYIAVNERLDQLTSSLPRDMPRPQVVRINTSDIPVIRVQVIPKEGISYPEVSKLAEKVLKKRFEQLEGVSLVDINGIQNDIIYVTPIPGALEALGEDAAIVTRTIQNANRELGGLSTKDGQYRYFIRLSNILQNVAAIEQLPVKLRNGTVMQLKQIAKIEQESEKQTGYHLYNGTEGLAITVQKLPGSRMNEVVPSVLAVVKQFRADYPNIDFFITQDQTFLLDAGISNLEQDLIYGGILTIGLLFLFLGNWASPTLMSISIPLSLIITFIFFYFLGISFNIISLSGLALGIGMLIDNSIVVIDSITRKRRRHADAIESSITGTREVIAPVISQVLTTVAVYAPLVLLNGMAGSLVFDQSIALTISLAVSLLVAFILTPVLYKLFMKNSPARQREDTAFYKKISRGYHKMIDHILQHKSIYFSLTLLLMPVGFWLAGKIPISALPVIEKKESLVLIDWNEPVDAQKNLEWTKELQQQIKGKCEVSEAEVGIQQFLFQDGYNSIEKLKLYFFCNSEKAKLATDSLIKKWLVRNHPDASVEIQDAPNAFTQLFASSMPYFEVRFKPAKNAEVWDSYIYLDSLLNNLPFKNYTPGAGLITEKNISLLLDYNKMAMYGISRGSIEDVLQQQFGIYQISDIKRYGEIKRIQLKTDRTGLEAKLEAPVYGKAGSSYPLSYFTRFENGQQPKFITADKTGEYKSILVEAAEKDIPAMQEKITSLANKYGFNVYYTGQYYQNRQQIKQLWVIFGLVLFLLYFILAIQYENLVLPLLVMFTIPLGITGGMFFLWLSGGTLDVMAAIGFIVILGLIVDDPILKVETLNRLEKQYFSHSFQPDGEFLKKMIHEAGDICLKPLLMVSLTTSIALVPILFIGGIGNELQKPMAVVIIGGLTVGTFFTTWFIPLAYWYLMRWKYKFRNKK